jgi:hypothetical protein
VEGSGRLFKELSRNFAGVTRENHETFTHDSWPNRNSGDCRFSRKTTLQKQKSTATRNLRVLSAIITDSERHL